MNPNPLDARRIVLRYDDFGWSALERAMARDGEALPELLGRAIDHFETELGASRAALRAPRFKPRGRGPRRDVRLELDAGRWARLKDESGRQGVSLERLLEHVQMLYIADISSGRADGREDDGATATAT